MFEEQQFTNCRGKVIDECETPCVGLVFCYHTSVMSMGHDYPRGYIITKVYNKKNSMLINKAEAKEIISVDHENNTVEYDDATLAILNLSQAGRWIMRNGGGSDPSISFGELQLPWTEEERKSHLQYSLGN